jgi:hypothetical protein
VGRAGPRSLPLWLPLPAYGGFLTRDVTASVDAGLRVRPMARTVRDILADVMAARSDATHITGLTVEEEVTLLREWHTGRRAG